MKTFGIVRSIIEFLRGLDDGDDGADEAHDGDGFGAGHRENGFAKPDWRRGIATRKEKLKLLIVGILQPSLRPDETLGYSTLSIGWNCSLKPLRLSPRHRSRAEFQHSCSGRLAVDV